MKVSIMFKTPDWDDQLNYLIDGNSTKKEIEEIAAMKESISKKWLEYNECITIEFDMNKNTATVVER